MSSSLRLCVDPGPLPLPLPDDLTNVIVVWLIVGSHEPESRLERIELGQPTTDFEPCRFHFVEVGQEEVPVHEVFELWFAANRAGTKL